MTVSCDEEQSPTEFIYNTDFFLLGGNYLTLFSIKLTKTKIEEGDRPFSQSP